MKRILAMVFAAALAASAEEKSELRLYNVEALTVKVTNFRGPEVGFDAMGIGSGSDMGAIGIGTSGGEEEGTAIPGEDLKLYITQNVAASTWDTPPHAIEYQNGTLFVTHTPAVQAQVKAFLDVVRSRMYQTVVIEADVLELAPGTFDAAAGSVLTDEQLKAIDAAAADPAKGRRLATLRASGLNGQRFNATAVSQQSYVADYDVEIAQKMAIADPVVDLATTGYVLDVRPIISGDSGSILLETRFSSADGLALRSFSPGGKYLGVLEEPDLAAGRARTSLVIPAGKTSLLSAASYSGVAGGWSQVVLVRPSIAADAPLAFPETKVATRLRVFDTRAILANPPTFEGPRLGGIRVGGKTGSPTTAFVVPEVEQGVLIGAEQLETMIKHDVDPESWTAHEGEYSIALTGNQQLLVVQTPENLKLVEAFLERLMKARSRMVSVDSWVVALDAASWHERHAALSGDLTDAAWNDLLAAAAKGQGVRIAGAARAAGVNGSRFHAARGLVRTLVQDHDVEIAESASSIDPVVSGVAEGISLDVTPSTVGDSGQVQLDLRPTVVLGGEPQEFKLKDNGGIVQVTSLADFGVRTQMLVDAGKPALVGVASREDGGKTEILLLFVKATVIDPK